MELFFLPQILIQETGETRQLSVGLVTADHSHHVFPGCETDGDASVGYHVGDGKMYDSDNPKFGRHLSGNAEVLSCWGY